MGTTASSSTPASTAPAKKATTAAPKKATTAQPVTVVLPYEGPSPSMWFHALTKPVLAAAPAVESKARYTKAPGEITLTGSRKDVAAVQKALRTVWAEAAEAIKGIKEDEAWKAVPKGRAAYQDLHDRLGAWAGQRAQRLL